MTMILTIMQTYRFLSLLQVESDLLFFCCCFTKMPLSIFPWISFFFVIKSSGGVFLSHCSCAFHQSMQRNVCNTGRRRAHLLLSLDHTSLREVQNCWWCVSALPPAAELRSLLESLSCAHIEGVDNDQTRSDSSDTKAALTSSLLVASKGRSCTLLTQNTSHHSWEAGTSCFITRHETDFFQL